jgi:GAF domain-containing protein
MDQPEFPPELLEALHALENLMPLQTDLEATLSRISDVAVSLLPGCDSASVTVEDGDDVRTVGTSDGTAIELDRAQYRDRSGPCLDAIERKMKVMVDDLETETRWPEFTKQALENGFRSVLSSPLAIEGIPAGLNLYGRAVNGFSGTPQDLTDLLVARAAVAIENARLYGASHRLIDQLNEAVKTRELIGKATGILMAREGVSDEEAFQMLVTASQNTNTKLRDIAQKLVEDHA